MVISSRAISREKGTDNNSNSDSDMKKTARIVVVKPTTSAVAYKHLKTRNYIFTLQLTHCFAFDAEFGRPIGHSTHHRAHHVVESQVHVAVLMFMTQAAEVQKGLCEGCRFIWGNRHLICCHGLGRKLVRHPSYRKA
jgi:hypothetical protein